MNLKKSNIPPQTQGCAECYNYCTVNWERVTGEHISERTSAEGVHPMPSAGRLHALPSSCYNRPVKGGGPHFMEEAAQVAERNHKLRSPGWGPVRLQVRGTQDQGGVQGSQPGPGLARGWVPSGQEPRSTAGGTPHSWERGGSNQEATTWEEISIEETVT